MDSFEFQLTMFMKGAEELPKKINHLNDLRLQIKIALLTIWSVSIGWAISANSLSIAFVGYCIIIGFLGPDTLVRASQEFYIDKLFDIYLFLNDREKLENSFKVKEIPKGIVYPIVFKISALANEKRREVYSAIKILSFLSYPTIYIPYLFLSLCNFLVILFLI